MRIGSLFSGYGGLDIAVQSVLGGDLAWYSEIEPAACKVLAAHHPGVPNLGDITTVDWASVPPVDVLTGGYPCQPFSHAGKRKGTNDERHLWPYVRDAIAAIRPMVAVFENVDGHRSLGLADVLGDLAELGMSVRWGVVRAADAGAPHGRKRVFIVAQPGDTDRVAWQAGRARLRRPAAVHQPRAIQRTQRSDINAAADTIEQGLQGRDVPATAVHRAGPAGAGADRGAEPAADPDLAGFKARGTSTRGASGEPTAGQRELVGRDATTRREVASDSTRDGRDGCSSQSDAIGASDFGRVNGPDSATVGVGGQQHGTTANPDRDGYGGGAGHRKSGKPGSRR